VQGGPENKSELLPCDLEQWNCCCCDFLTSNGCHGDQLKACAPVRKMIPVITVPNSTARVHAIQKVKTSGQMFFVTGRQHWNACTTLKATCLLSYL